MSKTIMHSVVAFGLLSFAAMPALAAGPTASFQPSQAWSVATANLSAGATPLCTIQSQYNNGFVIGFSGAEKNLKSMSVNFRQDIFEPGKTYDVSFSTPGNPPQSLSARALNASTLSTNVQNSKGLYKTLKDSTAFDMGVEGNNFRFHLAGFNNGTAAFDQCMTKASGTPAKQQEAKNLVAPPNAAPAMINESIALEEQESGKKIASMEILPGETKPQVSKMDVKETTKIDGIELTPEEANKLHGTAPASRKRMSETLAAKIESNPDIIDIENTPDALKNKSAPSAKSTEDKSIAEANEAAAFEASEINGTELTPPPAIERKSAAIAPAEKPQESAKKEAVKAAEAAPEEKPAMKVGSLAPDEKIIFSQPRKGDQPINTPAEKPSNRKTENYKSPAPVIKTTRTDAGTLDVTGYDTIEPAGDEPFSGTYEHIETNGKKNAKADTLTPSPYKTASNNHQANDAYRAPGEAPVTPTKADPEMLRKISELEDMVRDLKAQNNVLNAKGGAPTASGAPGSIADANWNLERATMRYTEAERELKRIAQQLQQERAQCNMQKQDIEAQLFDPQVASQQQLAKLGGLEQQLADAQQKLTDQRLQYEERIRILESRKQ